MNRRILTLQKEPIIVQNMQGARLLAFGQCSLVRQSMNSLEGLIGMNQLRSNRTAASGSARDTQTETDVAVVGGGMAGLSAAESLHSSQLTNFRVSLFDKGTSLGGRCSGRPMGPKHHIVHHGCQIIYPQSTRFRAILGECALKVWSSQRTGRLVAINQSGNVVHNSKEILHSYAGQFVGTGIAKHGDERCMYVGHQASAVLDQYFSSISQEIFCVQNHCVVTDLCWSDQDSKPWTLTFQDTKNGEKFQKYYHEVLIADWSAVMDLLLQPKACKVPKSLQEMLRHECIDQVEYLPTIACIVGVEGKRSSLSDILGFDTALIDDDITGNGPLSSFKLISLHSSQETKDGTNVEYWVLLLNEKSSKGLLSKHPMLDSDRNVIPQTKSYRQALAREMESDFQAAMNSLLGKDFHQFTIHESFGHRWGRAFTKPGTEIRSNNYSLYIPEYRIGVCGDMFATESHISPIERAWCSGQKVGESLASYYIKRSKF